MDKDCFALLKRMYGSEDGSTKKDLMDSGDLLATFFEIRRKLRKCCCFRLWLWTISLEVCWIEGYLDTERDKEY
jgi:hypothetical protein